MGIEKPSLLFSVKGLQGNFRFPVTPRLHKELEKVSKLSPAIQTAVITGFNLLCENGVDPSEAVSLMLEYTSTASGFLRDTPLVARAIKALAEVYLDPTNSARGPLPATYTGLGRAFFYKRIGKARILYDVVDRKPKVYNIDYVKDLYGGGTLGRRNHS